MIVGNNLSPIAMEQRREVLESSKAHSVPSHPLLNLWLPLLIRAIHTNPIHQTPSPNHALTLLPWTSFPWHKRILSDGDCSYGGRKKGFFFFLKGRGVSSWGGFLGSMLKPICVGERGSAINSELFSHQPVLINSASGALTWQWAGGCGGAVSHSVWVCLLCGSGVSEFTEDDKSI